MQIPLEIKFRNVQKSPRVEALIREKVDKLERFCDRITGCRVAIERPHQHETNGNPYRIRIDLTVPPGREIVVTKEPGDNDLHDNIQTVIKNAFKAAERQLKESIDRLQGNVKSHIEPRALVVRLFKEQDYGFLKTPEGREIFFHRNSVTHQDFDRLEIGTEVRFEESEGQKGPQASTVQIVNKPGSRVSSSEREEVDEFPVG